MGEEENNNLFPYAENSGIHLSMPTSIIDELVE